MQERRESHRSRSYVCGEGADHSDGVTVQGDAQDDSTRCGGAGVATANLVSWPTKKASLPVTHDAFAGAPIALALKVGDARSGATAGGIDFPGQRVLRQCYQTRESCTIAGVGMR